MIDKLKTGREVSHCVGFGRIYFVLLSLLALLPFLGYAVDHIAYDPAKDSFYSRKPIYLTWVMIWNGSTEKHWWKQSDYNGCKVLVDGSWQSINWNDDRHIDTYCRAIRDAGIDAIAVDFTNGFKWEPQAQRIMKFCHENRMKFTVAFNSQGGSQMEAGCKKIWNTYASPGSLYKDAYLYKDGKPLVILYTTRDGYEASISIKGPHRKMFSTAWASGEDSDKNKWGWQLEPEVGPVSSKEAMFATGSVKFGSPRTPDVQWRKHLSWLDYSFIMAKQSNPDFLIVGSFDDVHERNAWMVADTENAAKGWQMRGKDGALSKDAYYKRVNEWVKGIPTTVEGGLIQDGAYLVKSANGCLIGAADNRRAYSSVVLTPPGESIEHFIWFYHLGENMYRVIKLNAGLPLECTNSKVILNWDSEAETQRWILDKSDRGFRLLNKASGEVLSYSGNKVITEDVDDTSPTQYWSLINQATVSESQDKLEQSDEGDAAISPKTS